MLNYVWISLLFLGLASALFIDISDIADNKYNNDVPLSVTIKTTNLKTSGGFNCEVSIEKESFNIFFKSNEKENITLNAVGSFTEDQKAIQLYVKTDENSPEKLIVVAKASGKDNDILARASIISKQDSVTYSSKVYFEKLVSYR